MEWFKTAKAGDKLSCIHNGKWYEDNDISRPAIGPKLNEIVTITRTAIRHDGKLAVYLKEYKNAFNATCFKTVTTLSTVKGMEVFSSILNGKLRVEDKELENV